MGRVYSRLAGENRIVVPGTEVARNFKDALLAREDSRFYSHRGIDPIGIVRAIVRNLTNGSAAQGASTLTQQLARNSFPLGGKTLHRKLLEAFVAARIEQTYSKEQILEFYMNRIYFGPGGYGIETASLSYFGKHAADLSLGEAAMIAGIIRAPSYFSPFCQSEGRGEAARPGAGADGEARQNHRGERARPPKPPRSGWRKSAPVLVQENYAMDAVERELNILLSDDQRAEGGLKSLHHDRSRHWKRPRRRRSTRSCGRVEQRPGYKHPRRADFSQKAKDDELPTPYLQGALVVDRQSHRRHPRTGRRPGFFREQTEPRDHGPKRQVGSTFKPFVYAAAFSAGLLPGTLIDDGPIARGEIQGAGGLDAGQFGWLRQGALARGRRPDPVAQHDERAGRRARGVAGNREARRGAVGLRSRCRSVPGHLSGHL